MKRDEKALERIIERFQNQWQEEAKEAINRLYSLLGKGMKVDTAVTKLQKEFPNLFTLPNIEDALVEAACYGYGIVPSVLNATQLAQWKQDLSKSWCDDDMDLSKRLHGASTRMRQAIIETLREQMRQNKSWVDTARALYDGYNHGNVVREQELPKYLTMTRRATQGNVQRLRDSRKAINNIKRLSKNGSTTKNLKSAYSQLIDIAENGSEKQIEKACWVAIQERSRYVADRIARTELARAWGDGFLVRIADDDDVVAVKWTISTRHPVFDICDMYAKADMYHLGKGIYPKDKMPPFPAHPHCLCRMVEVFVGEVDMDKKKENIKSGGDKWLKNLSQGQRRKVLGIEGEKKWSNGADWRKSMYSWKGMKMYVSRLQTGGRSYPGTWTYQDEYNKRDAHAKKQHEAYRNNGEDSFVQRLQRRVNISEKRARRIFRHVFITEHLLNGKMQQFPPDHQMISSLDRLLSKNEKIYPHDLLLLRHEHLELALMQKLGYIYDIAHPLANTKYDFGKEAVKWEKENAKAKTSRSNR